MRQRVLKLILTAVAAVVSGFFITGLVYPPVVTAALVVAGRGPSSSIADVLNATKSQSDFVGAFERLQASSRTFITDKAVQFTDTPFGKFWEPRVNGSNAVGQWAKLEAKYMHHRQRFVRRGEVVLDCGANIGVFTRAALNAGAALVVAIEPSPRNLACLRRNFAAEIASGRVIVEPVGVWDREETLTMLESDAPPEDGFVEGSMHSAERHTGPVVRLTTIDMLVEKLGLTKVDFIKFDIEGSEQRALMGARKTITLYSPRLDVAVYHLPEDPERIPAIVRGFSSSYTICPLGAHLRRDVWRVQADTLLFDPKRGG